MLNPKITIEHYKIYRRCSNVGGVQVELKHKLSKGIHGSVMKYTRKYNEISTKNTLDSLLNPRILSYAEIQLC